MTRHERETVEWAIEQCQAHWATRHVANRLQALLVRTEVDAVARRRQQDARRAVRTAAKEIQKALRRR